MTILSVIMPNYNYGHFIGTALDSILMTNSSNDFELIVIDDASTDDSNEVLKKYTSDPRVKIFYNRQNIGAAKTIQKGIEKAKGSYLHVFSSDDFHLPGSIDFMIPIIKKESQIPLFCSHYLYFHSLEELKVSPILPKREAFFHLPAKTVRHLFSHTDFWIPGHTVFMNRQSYQKYGPFNEKMGPLCDWIVNHQIALNHDIGYLRCDLIATRKHCESFSASISMEKRKEIWILLLQLCRTNPTLKALSRTGLFRMLGLRAIYKSMIANPFYWKYAIPILRREMEKWLFKRVGINLEQYLINRIDKEGSY